MKHGKKYQDSAKLVNTANLYEAAEALDLCVKTAKAKFDETEEERPLKEVLEAENMFLDKIWFDRHLSLEYRIEQGIEDVNPEIWKGAMESARKVIEKYGEENLGPYSDFEWGMLNGKLSALRWVLGYEWDMLDT